MNPSKVLILYGDGINCERETARAFQEEGTSPRLIHVNEFLNQPAMLLEHAVFALPGGFSFGDELRSGKILAEKMRSTFLPIFKDFTKRGGLTIGICNGFQVLIQLGVFEGVSEETRTVTLATSDSGKFLDRWVEVELTDAAKKSPWFAGMSGKLSLPMRHKEGRIVPRDETAARSLHIPLRYTENVNGSYDQAAALLDSTGQILGIMPHPEAATYAFLNPSGTDTSAEVRKLFQRGKK